MKNRISKIRESKGITRAFMAEKLGLTRNGYYKIEQGERKLDLFRAKQIAGLLGVSIEELIKEDES